MHQIGKRQQHASSLSHVIGLRSYYSASLFEMTAGRDTTLSTLRSHQPGYRVTVITSITWVTAAEHIAIQEHVAVTVIRLVGLHAHKSPLICSFD